MSYRELLRERAQDQHGFVTTRDANQLDVPPVELRKLAARGGLDNVGYGIYRVRGIQHTDLDQYAEAVLRVGLKAHLTQDAVLAMHGLALVNPARIRVGTPNRVRAGLPDFIRVVHEHVPDEDLTAYDGIRSTTVARALLDSRGIVMDDRLRDGIKEAAREGLITSRQVAKLRLAFRRPLPSPARRDQASK